MKVVIGDITMDNTVDDNGCQWIVTAMDGWESPDVRQVTPDFASRDGLARGLSTYGGRPMNFEGICKTPNEAAFWKSYNRLLGLSGNLTSPFNVTVSEDVDKYVSCIRAQGLKAPVTPGYFAFTLPLIVTHPLKYQTTSVTAQINGGASAVLTNNGNYPSMYIRVTLTSNGTLKLKNAKSGLRLVSTKTMTSGTVLDFKDRTVLLNDADRYGQLSPLSDWWTLAEGDTTIQNNGTANVSVEYRSAWI